MRKKISGTGSPDHDHPAKVAYGTARNERTDPTLAELKRLADVIEQGLLSERADLNVAGTAGHETLAAVNRIVEAMTRPLGVAANYVDRISKGDLPPKITDTYHGEFNTIKNNLNNCIEQLGGLITEMNRMSDEHNKGDIDVAMPLARFEGAYRDMARGVNEMVGGHIMVKKKPRPWNLWVTQWESGSGLATEAVEFPAGRIEGSLFLL
jgi:methyl-accepting chemotaxis protein